MLVSEKAETRRSTIKAEQQDFSILPDLSIENCVFGNFYSIEKLRR